MTTAAMARNTVNTSHHIKDCAIRFQDTKACACVSRDPLVCDNGTLFAHPCSCVYYDPALNLTVVGNCFFSCYNFLTAPNSITTSERFNAEICDTYGMLNQTLNRVGRFCGECKAEYGLAVYSYQLMECTPCQHYGYKNWLKYFAVALLPLTLFYVLAVLLSCNVTSSSLNAIVLIIQCLASPAQMIIIRGWPHLMPFNPAVAIFITIFCIVNLDFFRFVYPSFCVHPKANILHVLSLDYIVGLYPFFLIFMTYLLVAAHDRRYSVIVWLWKPFQMCVRKHRDTWFIRTSLVEIFATFILLSYVKILGVSLQILSFTSTRDVAGNKLGKYYSLYDANIEYLGATHLPFALLAMVVSAIFILLPFLLLAFYPCRCFHKCLECFRVRSPALHVFMDAFQGSYRTQPRDMRYFSAFYLLLRMLLIAQPQIFTSTLMMYTSGILSIVASCVVAICQPYKVSSHNTRDSLLLLLMGVYFLVYYAKNILTVGISPYRWQKSYVLPVQFFIIVISALYILSLFVSKLKIPTLLRRVKLALRSSRDREGGSNGNEIEAFDRDMGTGEGTPLL